MNNAWLIWGIKKPVEEKIIPEYQYNEIDFSDCYVGQEFYELDESEKYYLNIHRTLDKEIDKNISINIEITGCEYEILNSFGEPLFNNEWNDDLSHSSDQIIISINKITDNYITVNLTPVEEDEEIIFTPYKSNYIPYRPTILIKYVDEEQYDFTLGKPIFYNIKIDNYGNPNINDKLLDVLPETFELSCNFGMLQYIDSYEEDDIYINRDRCFTTLPFYKENLINDGINFIVWPTDPHSYSLSCYDINNDENDSFVVEGNLYNDNITAPEIAYVFDNIINEYPEELRYTTSKQLIHLKRNAIYNYDDRFFEYNGPDLPINVIIETYGIKLFIEGASEEKINENEFKYIFTDNEHRFDENIECIIFSRYINIKVSGNDQNIFIISPTQFDQDNIRELIETVDLGLPSGNIWTNDIGYTKWGNNVWEDNDSYKIGDNLYEKYVTLPEYGTVDYLNRWERSDSGDLPIPSVIDFEELFRETTHSYVDNYLDVFGPGIVFESISNGQKLFLHPGKYWTNELDIYNNNLAKIINIENGWSEPLFEERISPNLTVHLGQTEDKIDFWLVDNESDNWEIGQPHQISLIRMGNYDYNEDDYLGPINLLIDGCEGESRLEIDYREHNVIGQRFIYTFTVTPNAHNVTIIPEIIPFGVNIIDFIDRQVN